MFDGHVLLAGCSAASLVVVEQAGGFRECGIVEDAQVARSRHPVAVRRFLMIHHAERFALVPAFEEFDGLVCDDVRGIPFLYDMFAVFPEIGVVIIALFVLAAQDAPVVEALRFADKMPFANHGRLVAGLLEQFRECLLVAVEGACIIRKAVFVAELTGKDAGA